MPRWIERFKWDGKDQQRGYLGFLSWAKSKGLKARVKPIDLFFIQKDHESHVYWLELTATQNEQLRFDIAILQRQVRAQELRIRELEGEK